MKKHYFHQWFAWRPVLINRCLSKAPWYKRIRWLVFVDRIGVINWGGDFLYWSYQDGTTYD